MHSQKGLEYSGRHKLVDISTILPPLLTDSYNTITINVGKAARLLFAICSTTTKANGKSGLKTQELSSWSILLIQKRP